MKFTLNIETNDPNDLARIAAAMLGQELAVAPPTSPKERGGGSSANAGAATAPSSTGSAQTAEPSKSPAASERAPASTQTAHGAAASVAPSEADIVAAANAAVAKIGPSGAAKVKEYVAKNFQCADGSPGKLKQVAESQRANLLAGLQGIAQGTVTV